MHHTSVHNRLKQYSLLASASLVLMRSAEAEVIYTDIQPDAVIDEEGELLLLDINTDGLYDVWFTFESFWDTEAGVGHQGIYLHKPFNDVSIAGSKAFTYSSGWIYYASAIAAGELINDYDKWKNANDAFNEFAMASRITFSNGLGTITGYSYCENCYWFGALVPYSVDKYLAIKISSDSENHFAWIRCDVVDEGRTLIVKDYAYETTANNPIITGDTIDYITVHNQLEIPEIITFVEDDYLYLVLDAHENSTLQLFDMNGSCFSNTHLVSGQNKIETKALAPALYIIYIQNGSQSITRKLILGE